MKKNKFKVCSKCKFIKPIDAFYKNSSHKDGLSSSCKDCVDVIQKIYNKTKGIGLIKENKLKLLNKGLKECKGCNKIKPIKEFRKGKQFGNLNYYCKVCEDFYNKLYRINNKEKVAINRKNWLIKNPWMASYSGAKDRCCNKNNARFKDYGLRGIKFLMTPEDFKSIWFRDKAYLMKRPSIDRIDNNGNYILSNCQFIELNKNSAKDKFKSIIQFDLDGNFIKEWKSLGEVSKYLSMPISTLSKCVIYKKIINDFIWKYKKS
jgi:hypothetical protein